MGVVLDSSVLIAAEREKQAISKLLTFIAAEHDETACVISAVSVMELEHGWHRAQNLEQARNRRLYLDEVFAVIPVKPFTRRMGVLAARVDADARRAGLVIATADLLIGATAMHFGYSVATRNLRHFETISGLKIIRR